MRLLRTAFATLVAFGALTAVANAYVYWAVRGGSTGTNIGRANLDGTGVTQSFIGSATGPVGVAVNGTYIYWANTFGSHSTIGRAALNGDPASVSESFITGGNYPCGVAVNANYIYWANNGSSTIGRATLNGNPASVNQNFITTGVDHPCGVAVDGAHIYWANQGNNGVGTTIGRANLDGTSPSGNFITGANGPVGVAVNGSYIYWGNTNSSGTNANTIGRADIAGDVGSVNQSFIAGGSCPDLPAIDGTYIYWTNACDNSIGRAALDGTPSTVNQDFISVPSNPGGVAVDSLTSPTTVTNPISETVAAGRPASFTASATGTPAPTVQWQLSTNGGGSFQNITGATSTTYAITSASTTQSGDQFRAVFTSIVGSATTKAATLTVTGAGMPPRCTLSVHGASVKRSKGSLVLKARCDVSASVKLTGQITAVLKHKHKTFRIGAVHKPIAAGKTVSLTVKLPGAALTALKKGARESVVFTLTATGAHGSSTATAKIRRLKLKH